MTKITIAGLLRRTWELSSTVPALLAFVIFVVLNLVSDFGQRYYANPLRGSSTDFYAQFSLILTLLIAIATFGVLIILPRKLLHSGGAVLPSRWPRCILLMIAYSTIIGIISVIGSLLMTSFGPLEYTTYILSFITTFLRFLMLPILVRLVLLAGGESEPRLASIWRNLWTGYLMLAVGYWLLALAFEGLIYLMYAIWAVPGSTFGYQLRLGIGGGITAIGQVATIICVIAIAQAHLNPSAGEAEVFS